MNTIRALLIDDEALARKGMRILLRAHPEVEIVGECANALDGIAAIHEHAPDLIFLDIQMRKMNGFEMLEALEPEVCPLVVFVTAYDNYALTAFEVNATDYLLKPVSPESLERSICRVRKLLQGQPRIDAVDKLQAILKDYAYLKKTYGGDNQDSLFSPPSERIAIKENDRILFIPFDEISYVEACGDYVQVYQRDRKRITHDTLKNIEAKLPATIFKRVHRSFIVNAREIEELSSELNGAYSIKLKGCKSPIKSSRRYRETVRTLE